MTDVVDAFLAHHGIKGMHWGVRKADRTEAQASLKVRAQGIRMGKDGSIDIAPGANLQRLVRSNGESLPMKDLTYASINDYDNAKYIKTIGGKGFFGGGRDQILAIQATKPIRAPSFDESTKIVSELFLKDAKFRDTFSGLFEGKIGKSDLAKLQKNPAGKTAQAWYTSVNTAMTFSSDFDTDAPYVQKTVREHVLSKGYNALRDENDIGARISKAPVIIFNPQDSLKVISTTQITDSVRTANKEKLKQYKLAGKDWLAKEAFE